MVTHVRQETAAELGAYGAVPIAFEVRETLEVVDSGLAGVRLEPRPVGRPWVKDYDAIRGEGPTRWAKRWDTSRWGFLSAWHGGAQRVGGAVVAFDTPGVDMLRGRTDLAVLWDLRVAPAARGTGVGRALFEAAERWAARTGARELVVETQNINVPACRFYAAMGCDLGTIDRHAYPDHPNEVRLLWWKRLHVHAVPAH